MVNTIGDIYEGLSPDGEDMTPEGLVALVKNLEVRGWIKEEKSD